MDINQDQPLEIIIKTDAELKEKGEARGVLAVQIKGDDRGLIQMLASALEQDNGLNKLIKMAQEFNEFKKTYALPKYERE